MGSTGAASGFPNSGCDVPEWRPQHPVVSHPRPQLAQQVCAKAPTWPRYARSSQSHEPFNPSSSGDTGGPVASVSHVELPWKLVFVRKGPNRQAWRGRGRASYPGSRPWLPPPRDLSRFHSLTAHFPPLPHGGDRSACLL